MPRGIGVGTGYVSGQKSLRFGRVEMAEETIQTFDDAIATRASIDPAAAETAVGTILSVIQREGDAANVSQLFNLLPGAATTASGGSWFRWGSGRRPKRLSFESGRDRCGHHRCRAGADRTNKQIKNIGSALLSYIKDVNAVLAKEVFDRIPSLQKHFA